MKKRYSFLFLIFSVLSASAQIINFPDPNFKARLLAASPTESIAWDMNNAKMKIDANDDGEIQQSEASLVLKLDASAANITDLTGIESFIHCVGFIVQNTGITSFNISGMPAVYRIELKNNSNLTSVSISNLTGLFDMYLTNNHISSLTLTGLPQLYAMFCDNNNLTSIDLSQCSALSSCGLSNNELTSIVFPNYASATVPYEAGFDLSGNLFETLIAPNRMLGRFKCNNNPNLKYLNFKEMSHHSFNATGFSFSSDCSFSNCPSLEYVCARDMDLIDVQNLITYYGYTNCHVNTYCSFTPGGTFYTIQGTNTFDSSNNGCDSNDTLVPNMKYMISNGISNTTLVAGTNGSFYYDVSEGTYTITPVLENPSAYTANPANVTVSFPSAASPFIQDFCITPNGVHNDLEIALLPLTGARPGFDAVYKIIYKNNGTQTQSGTVSLYYYDPVSDFVSATPAITSQAANMLYWDFNNLQPFETREITVTLNINSPMETPAVNAGNLLTYTANIIGATDETPANNTAALTQTVVNSFDPNDKTCAEGNSLPVSEVGKYLHYIIRFENTGTANAENIVVKDMIDTSKLDINTLIPLSGSHLLLPKYRAGTKSSLFLKTSTCHLTMPITTVMWSLKSRRCQLWLKATSLLIWQASTLIITCQL